MEGLKMDTKLTTSKWMTTNEAAAYLKMAVITLQKYRQDNTGPRYYKTEEGTIRYNADDLDAYLINK